MTIKKIFKIISLVLLVATLTLAIATLVNYYGYVNVIEKAQETENVIEKFTLRDNQGIYLTRTLTCLLWTCYIAIATSLICIATHFVTRTKKTPTKIR